MAERDRIDRIESLLERFIDASVASQQASNERMTRLEQSMAASDERMKAMEDVDIAFQTISLMAENGDRDRAELRERADQDRAEFQAEVLRIWEYLMRRNGNGDAPQR